MKIGLFGGAFNPIHNGHMAVAKAAIEKGVERGWGKQDFRQTYRIVRGD